MTQKLPTHLAGKTKPYKGDGRKLGYPTANIDTPVNLSDGVYFGFADLEPYKKQPSLIFIGAPLTMGDTTRRVEAHLLDAANTDYYGQQLVLDIRHFHRPNLKFNSMNELQSAIEKDEVTARNWFAARKK
ncbi:MAG TPA: riboflavin kinase [Candidatus Saccharimonadales bacterium]|jgi:FAD synthase